MFMQILWTQFRWTRAILAVSAVALFVLPAVAWRTGSLPGYEISAPLAFMSGFRAVGPILMVVSWMLGFVLVAHPWNVDGAGKHVYPLSLPIGWSRYVAMRFGAGALTLLVPTLALWLGSILALALIEIPATLRAYPGALALRFLLGTMLVYALSFLLQYVAGRRAPLALLLILLGGLSGAFVLSILGFNETLTAVGSALTEWPGPLAVFASEWKLLDV